MRQRLWLLPMLLAMVFVALIAYWAEVNDAKERADYQNTLVADGQSVETQLIARQDTERIKLREVAGRLAARSKSGDADLQTLPEVVAGLDRLWNRLVWIDSDHQVVARADRKGVVQPVASDNLKVQSSGQAEHFVVRIFRNLSTT